MITHLEELAAVVASEIAPNAMHVDREGEYPRANIEALQAAGLFGLVSSTDVGGQGAGIRAATEVVGEIARHCASTAMIVCMHYAATAVIEAHGSEALRRDIAANRHLTTLAFSETGSRSHFWAPVSTARPNAGEATSYLWSSRPQAAEGASTLWLVPSDTDGLKIGAPFDGLGLRGNASSPVNARAATIPKKNMLGIDGGGFDLMIGMVLPWFNLMNSSMSVGLVDMEIECADCGCIVDRGEMVRPCGKADRCCQHLPVRS